MHPENTRFSIHQILIKHSHISKLHKPTKKDVHMDSFNQSNKSKKYPIQYKIPDVHKNCRFQIYTVRTQHCAQTANFIGDISNFLNITEYRCAYMRITEVIFFCQTLTLILSHRIRITNAIWRIKKPYMPTKRAS